MTDTSPAKAGSPMLFDRLSSFTDELHLEGDGESFRRELSSFWAFGDDRVFGGYCAAILLAAAARAAGLGAILSCHVMFLGISRPGPIEVRVEVLRRGRAAAAVRVVAEQAGEITITASAWFGSLLPGSAQASYPGVAPHPEDCSPIAFRAEQIPFMSVLEERAIDYPQSPAQFLAGPTNVELWARPRLPKGLSDLPLSQLFDVLLFDAHMLEPALRSRSSSNIWTASLDLAVIWAAASPYDDWRRVRIKSGSIANGFVATHGIISDAQGHIRARATQQGRARTEVSSGVIKNLEVNRS